MREIEKKIAIKLKEEAGRITPKLKDFSAMETNEVEPDMFPAEKVIRQGRRRTIKRRLALVASLLILFSIILTMDYILEDRGSDYSFQVLSFAGNEEADPHMIEEQLLEANISMLIPDGKLNINPDIRADMEPWEWAYGWGTGSFYVVGEDIARVTYSLKRGTLEYFDHAMDKKSAGEGKPMMISFFLPYSVFQLDETQISEMSAGHEFTEEFKALWEAGSSPEIEAIKESYFKGRNLDLEAYDTMNHVGTWDAAQKDGRYFRFYDRARREELTQRGSEVTVAYHHFDYGDGLQYHDSLYGVMWSPNIETKELLNMKTPADLPADEMTVTIELQNGDKIKKVILLTFNDEGYAVGKVK